MQTRISACRKTEDAELMREAWKRQGVPAVAAEAKENGEFDRMVAKAKTVCTVRDGVVANEP